MIQIQIGKQHDFCPISQSVTILQHFFFSEHVASSFVRAETDVTRSAPGEPAGNRREW